MPSTRRGGRMGRAANLAKARQARSANRTSTPTGAVRATSGKGTPRGSQAPKPAAPKATAPKAPTRPKAPERRMTDAEISAWNAKRGNATVGSYTRPKGQSR